MRFKIGLSLISLMLLSCSNHVKGPPPHGETGIAVAPQSLKGNGLGNAGPTPPVSGGPNTLGVSVPTARASIGRIENALEGRSPATAGNFNRAIAQVQSNLPRVSNPKEAAGYDQIQLLAYAACSDLTTGGTPIMQSAYNVQRNSSVSANQAALIAAGIRILDQNVAGLASQGPNATDVTTVFTTLVQAQITAGASSTVAFMAVCIAAATAGSTMMGI